jgi:hypothetical protein
MSNFTNDRIIVAARNLVAALTVDTEDRHYEPDPNGYGEPLQALVDALDADSAEYDGPRCDICDERVTWHSGAAAGWVHAPGAQDGGDHTAEYDDGDEYDHSRAKEDRRNAWAECDDDE